MKKKAIIITAIVLAAVLLIPIPLFYKDGGSVEYRAVLYSVWKVHSISTRGDGYEVGTEIRLLFWTVYNDVEYVPTVYNDVEFVPEN